MKDSKAQLERKALVFKTLAILAPIHNAAVECFNTPDQKVAPGTVSALFVKEAS